MGKWHGKNRSNKQSRMGRLQNRTKSIKNLEFKHELPIIFYCKKCKLETEKEGIFKIHKC